MGGMTWSNKVGLAILSFILLSHDVSASRQRRRTLVKKADPLPVKSGYVAFGDSFGAGMGTGTTTSDPCRIGSNNFGDLLYKFINNREVDFQRKVCSGDTTTGLNRQIDEWQTPTKADIATVSMGGNDLYFSDIVWYCILTPNGLVFDVKPHCNDAKDVAKHIMEDSGDGGLRSKLKNAYKRILDKSTRNVSVLFSLNGSRKYVEALSYIRF